ncbi:ankyrin repeat domain-containing protein SOWAHA [Phaenicophaeus curvirostris]|uniref:ankyrin repeat domain-containing protein SOWAHA n=1 Tax=Phaenicophaeus curvirostris TaxID=33595 RepID=UPI0037F0A45A
MSGPERSPGAALRLPRPGGSGRAGGDAGLPPPSPRAVAELRGLFQGGGAGVPVPGGGGGARRDPLPKPCMLPVRYLPLPAEPPPGPRVGAPSPPSPLRQGALSPPSPLRQGAPSPPSPLKEKRGSLLSPSEKGRWSSLSSPEEGTGSLLSPPEEEPGCRSPGPRQVPRGQRASEEPSAVPLEEAEHRWLVLAAGGQWTQQLHGLLLGDSSLAARRDFISGFTALHWAAKSGNCDMVNNIIRAAEKGGTRVNVDARSHGGYTALHLAAIHGQEKIITTLVYSYRANTDLRDYSGKKPHQYLKEGASSAVRRLLGDPSLAHNAEPSVPIKKSTKLAASILSSTSTFLGVISDDMAFYDLTKGLRKPSSLNKLLAATTGPRRKPKTRRGFPSYSSLSEAMEEEEEEIVMKRRPVSELFFGH